MQKTLLNNEYKEYEKCIKENEMDKIKALVVNGAFTVFLRDKQVSYFTLVGPVRHKQLKEIDYDGKVWFLSYLFIFNYFLIRHVLFSDVTDLDLPNSFGVNENLPDTPPSVHEQDDGTIVAICATGRYILFENILIVDF